jgi:predicted PurR-regulated permease PerM
MSPERADRLQALVWIGLGLAILWLLWLLSPILAPFLLAAILAYICDPLVDRLEGWRIPRPAGVLIVMLLLAAAIALLALTLVPLVHREALQLADRLPEAIAVLNERFAPWLRQRFGLDVQFDAAMLRQLLTDNQDGAQELAAKLLASLKIGGMALFGLLANLLLAPVVMFYLLRDWKGILARLENMIPRRWHGKSTQILHDIDAVLAEFLRGQVSVMLLLAIYYCLGLWAAGVDFALPLGLVTGLLVFIPYLGYATGFVLALLVATLQFEGWGVIIGMLLVFGVGQMLESFLLTPFLVGERIGLHPLAVIFALMAFGQLFGFFGVLLALPASAALLVGLREVRAAYLDSTFYRGS